jgi:Putative beta barrel porin-7 (BBP7)
MLSPVWTRGGRAATIVCVLLLLGIGLASSPAEAQSDVASLAPWQAHPSQGQWVPPEDGPSACCGRKDAAPRCGCNDKSGDEGDGPCDEECSVTDWCRWPAIFEPCGQLSFRGEYLGWWTKSSVLPPLATTSPATTPRSQAGVLGQPGTEILFDGKDGDQGVHSGARFTLGYWFSPCRDAGLEVTYLFLGNKAATFDEASNGSEILARPFFDVSTAAQNSVILAYPDQQRGSLNIRDADELNSVEVLYRQAVLQQCNRQLDFLFGYRFARFSESLSIDGSTTYISPVGEVPVGTVIQTSDLFGATNEFNGAEIGIVAKNRCCRWSMELLTKLAVGNTRSRVNISGATSVTTPGQAPVTYNGGVLALPTNIGGFERSDFSVIPEFGFTLGYDLTCRLKATVGWSFLYWSNIMRPGDQIDTNVNSTQFPPNTLRGVPSPQFKPVTTDFWAEGFNLGLDYRY